MSSGKTVKDAQEPVQQINDQEEDRREELDEQSSESETEDEESKHEADDDESSGKTGLTPYLYLFGLLFFI